MSDTEKRHYTSTDINKVQARCLHLFNRATHPEMMEEKTYINWVRKWKPMNHQMVDIIKQLKSARSVKGNRQTQHALLAIQRVATTSYQGRRCAKMQFGLGKEMDNQYKKMLSDIMEKLPSEELAQA